MAGLRAVWLLAVAPWVIGCATAAPVRLSTREWVDSASVESRPVEVSAAMLTEAAARLVLAHRLVLGASESGGGVRLAAWEAPRGATLLDPDERRNYALGVALDAAWEGVGVALKGLVDPLALRMMVTSMLGAAMVMMVAPEPVTKFIALALSVYLISYLGLGPVRAMLVGFLALGRETERATTYAQLEDSGRRFGRVVGENGTRVLVLLALALMGGREGLKAQGPTLPGYAQAALAAESGAGLQLASVATGGVQSVAGLASGAVVIGLTPAAVASVAWGSGEGGGPRPKGRLTGRPTKQEPNDQDADNVQAIKRENESAKTLVENGYDVEQNPPPKPNRKEPDYRIEGNYWDCYAPNTDSARNVATRIREGKIKSDQTDRIILNLDDANISIEAMRRQLTDWPTPGLQELIIIKDGAVVPILRR